MEKKRPYHRTKAAWAAANVTRLQATLDGYYEARVPTSNWRAVRSKMSAMETLRRDIRHYQALADRFTAIGV